MSQYKNIETIKKNKEIDYIFKNGKKYFLPYLTIILYKDKKEKIAGNVAFLAGKKYGNAVWRNRNKRRLREIYKKINLIKEYKILMIAKKNTIEQNFHSQEKDVKKIFKNIE